MTIPGNFECAVGVTKKEFKVIYKSMKALVNLINAELDKSLKKSHWGSKEDHPSVSVDLSTFKQAWKTVNIGSCPIYAIIHIHAQKNSETYLALEMYIANFLQNFCMSNHFTRINNPMLKDNKPIGKRKDRFRATNSIKYPWHGVYVRGKMDPINNNFRIVVKAERVFCNSNGVIVISSANSINSGKEELNNG